MDEVITPANVNRLHELLIETGYNTKETRFLCDGFKFGFDLGYRGPKARMDQAKNLPFTVGNTTELWNKVMAEVELGRFAGPYPRIPYSHYVQSPIGLVPKDNNKTRLIFHLSYQFKNGNQSVNFWTPEEMCSVKYNDLDSAIQNCLTLMRDLNIRTIYFSKSDLKSAFHILGIWPGHHCYLVMMAQDPISKKCYYFVDKCLPFGASISCSHFQ